MLIEIKFPRRPKTSQRRKIQDIGKKYDYSEDEYDSIIKINEINQDFKEIVRMIYGWNGSSCKIDNEEINLLYLNNLIDSLNENLPCTLLRLYGFRIFWNDIKDVRNTLKELNDKNYYGIEKNEYRISKLQEMNLISTLEYNKKYKVEKEKFMEEIISKTKIIKIFNPNFDNSEILSIIASFPEEIEIQERKSENDGLGEFENLSQEEISKQIIEFVKKEFPEEISSYDIKYDILPLFWERKGISFFRLSEEIKFKLKKAELSARKELEKESNHSKDDEESEELDEDSISLEDFAKETLELLRKIELNTQK